MEEITENAKNAVTPSPPGATIFGDVSTVLTIGIAGDSGSGKSTVACKVADALTSLSVAFIDMEVVGKGVSSLAERARGILTGAMGIHAERELAAIGALIATGLSLTQLGLGFQELWGILLSIGGVIYVAMLGAGAVHLQDL